MPRVEIRPRGDGGKLAFRIQDFRERGMGERL
jgi:hypothetical protein